MGEGFFEALLGMFEDPDHLYKIATLLQLETETKARLRPAILQLGGTVEQTEDARQIGRDLAADIASDDWGGFVAALNSAGEPLVTRQREVANIAPAAHRELAESMRIHGESIENFTEREMAGEVENSIEDVVQQLKFPLERPG